jgi:NADH-quinone oxidoreductase subunit F
MSEQQGTVARPTPDPLTPVLSDTWDADRSWTLASYVDRGGYAGLRAALAQDPADVVATVKASGLRGRGGAGFPTGMKWGFLPAPDGGPRYLVVNADESEPGTCKDIPIMMASPQHLIEGMIITSYAIGCHHAFLYVRGEVLHVYRRLLRAIEEARAAGYVGKNILGSDFSYELHVVPGYGAYICGEETALFNSIEGKRGEPRSKPPFPAEVGVFGKPTVANNVETLVNVLDILLEGGAEWARTGTPASTGPRLFCLSGHVEQPGLYEVPFGTTLREVIGLAGGVSGGRAIKAVLLGGAAGSFVTPEHLDMPLTFEAAREAGTTLGSGVVMVFDESADIGDALQRMAAFFRDESCGQCVPCRVGTVRQQELLPALATDPRASSAVFLELSTAMRDASICGLGQTASAAIESALKLGLIQEHVRS